MTLSVIRPVTVDDFDQLLALARQSDGGMTNLPSDADALRPRVEFAASCFENNPTAPNGEVYQLVLEENGKIMGTSAVFSAIGLIMGLSIIVLTGPCMFQRNCASALSGGYWFQRMTLRAALKLDLCSCRKMRAAVDVENFYRGYGICLLPGIAS